FESDFGFELGGVGLAFAAHTFAVWLNQQVTLFHCPVFGVHYNVSTMRKQGRDVLDAIEAALIGQPFALLPS
ncbi:hypothetical protein, partial [Rhodocaloribacter sp.]